MKLSFENKVALVTGDSSGMGLATAKAFAEAGAAVVLADIHEKAVHSAEEELLAAGHRALAVRCNVADEAEVAAMVEKTVSTFNRVVRRSTTPGFFLQARTEHSILETRNIPQGLIRRLDGTGATLTN